MPICCAQTCVVFLCAWLPDKQPALQMTPLVQVARAPNIHNGVHTFTWPHVTRHAAEKSVRLVAWRRRCRCWPCVGRALCGYTVLGASYPRDISLKCSCMLALRTFMLTARTEKTKRTAAHPQCGRNKHRIICWNVLGTCTPILCWSANIHICTWSDTMSDDLISISCPTEKWD